MAIRRYRHFWTARLHGAAVDEINPRTANNPPTVTPGSYQHDIAAGQFGTDADLSSIIKNYEPPRFMREVREIATGKVVNERILGRMDAPATNFSITLPSEFERMYGYNADYNFIIEEELHDNEGGIPMLLRDDVTGTLFDRESSVYEHGSADRDWTIRFILKKFKRTLEYPGNSNSQSRFGITSATNFPMATMDSINLIDADMTTPNPTVNFHANLDMFGRNRAIPPTP